MSSWATHHGPTTVSHASSTGRATGLDHLFHHAVKTLPSSGDPSIFRTRKLASAWSCVPRHFFPAPKASVRARIALLDALKPIALVNLSALRDELFPTADYPAVVLFARLHNLSEDDRVPIVTIPWTSTFSRSGSFEIASSDVRTARLSELSSRPQLLKATALGTPRDRLLLRRMAELGNHCSFPSRGLGHQPSNWSTDTQRRSQRCLPPDRPAVLGRQADLSLHIDVNSLPLFDRKQIHRPRAKTAFVGSACSRG